MNSIINMVNAWIISLCFGAKRLIANEVRRIRDDESGMELIQVVLIILIVVVIAAALWAFLGDYISDLIQKILGGTPDPAQGDIYN